MTSIKAVIIKINILEANENIDILGKNQKM